MYTDLKALPLYWSIWRYIFFSIISKIQAWHSEQVKFFDKNFKQQPIFLRVSSYYTVLSVAFHINPNLSGLFMFSLWGMGDKIPSPGIKFFRIMLQISNYTNICSENKPYRPF